MLFKKLADDWRDKLTAAHKARLKPLIGQTLIKWQFETSLVMASRPELIDEGQRQASEDNPASLTEAFANGAKTFEEAGGPEA